MTEERMRRNWKRMAATLLGVATASIAGASGASADTCRDWRREHMDWKIETVRRYLGAAPQTEVEAAVFEVLQREAYLTSCETSLRAARAEMLGWRLIERVPEEYGSAVLESVLECAGFEPDLRGLFDVRTATVAATPARPAAKARRSRPRFKGARRR
jgi:hypothetical protein